MAVLLGRYKLVRVFCLAVVVVALYVYSFNDLVRHKWRSRRSSVRISQTTSGNNSFKREREFIFRHLNNQPSKRPSENQTITLEDEPDIHRLNSRPIRLEKGLDRRPNSRDKELQSHYLGKQESISHDDVGGNRPITVQDDIDVNNGEEDVGQADGETVAEGSIIRQLRKSKMINRVNYDVWRRIVGFTVDDMRIVKSFPNFPDERSTIDTLHIRFNDSDPDDIKGKYSHKIYGYLLPPADGDYQFSIEMIDVTAAGCVELWLSNGSDPLHMQKILVLEHEDWERQIIGYENATSKKVASEPIKMNSSIAYYFEFLEKTFDGNMIVDIKWKSPYLKDFVEIQPENLAMAAKFDHSGELTEGPSLKSLIGPLPSDWLQSHFHAHYDRIEYIHPVTDISVLPNCDFKPAYAVKHKVKPLTGGNQVHESRVYPDDQTKPQNCSIKGWKSLGNPKIAGQTLRKILKMYKKAFKAKLPFNHSKVVGIHHMEETFNRNFKPKWRKKKIIWPIYGSRFLLEMSIEVGSPKPQMLYTSEYVYLEKGTDKLCHTVNFQWKRPGVQKAVDVYFVVAMKNLGVWVDHLIHNMENIYTETKDDHFELVVVDFESEDEDVEEKLNKSSINRWHFIGKKGNFSRSAGLQAGIDYVTNPDSIVMTIDMHLTLPPGFVEYVRRHTVQGKMACAPFFFRLDKGYTEINMVGFWEVYTYGLIAMFKSDWNVTGGFDVEHYTTSWGGEDWNMVDRIVQEGYELFRIRYPGLVHYYHTKAGMWGVDGAKNRPV